MSGSTDLTPVRIRGKRRSISRATPSTSSPPSANQPTSSHSRKQTKRAGPASGSTQKQDHKRRRGNASGQSAQLRDTPNLASLERLPIELLEIIFFECLNFSLPRASASIGKRLASNHVKTKLYYHAFCLLDHCELGQSKGQDIHAIDMLRQSPGIGAFQSDLLALKWFTPTFLHNVMRGTLMKAATAFILDESNLDLLKIPSAPITEAFATLYKTSRSSSDKRWAVDDTKTHTWSLASVGLKVDGAPAKSNDSYMRPIKQKDHGFKVVFWFYQGFSHRTSIETSLSNSRSCLRDFYLWDLLFPMDGCRLPQKLLRGPWNQLKCTMLTQLLVAGCVLDRSGSSTDEEVANEGLVEAIAQPSVRAIVTLVGSLRRFAAECTSAIEEGFEIGKQFGTIQSVGLTVTNETLMLALAKDSSLQVLECLIDARDLAVDWRDEAIREWAWRKKQQGDKRGQFLLDRYADVDVTGGTQPQRITKMPHAWINSKPSWVDDEEDFEEFSGSDPG